MNEINQDPNKTGHKFNQEYKQKVKDYFQQNGQSLKVTLKWVRQTYPTFKRKILRTWVDEEYAKHIREVRERNNKNWKINNPEKYAEISKINQANQILKYGAKRNEKNKIWRKNNPEHVKQYQKDWWIKNKDRELGRKRKRKQEDPIHKLLENTRTYIWQQIQKAFESQGKEFNKTEHTSEITGCTPSEYLKNLQRQYKPGMTDENYGKEWHVDHIIPCSSFDLTDKKQMKQCFNYKNTQPLWAHENLAKSDKYEPSETETDNPF